MYISSKPHKFGIKSHIFIPNFLTSNSRYLTFTFWIISCTQSYMVLGFHFIPSIDKRKLGWRFYVKSQNHFYLIIILKFLKLTSVLKYKSLLPTKNTKEHEIWICGIKTFVNFSVLRRRTHLTVAWFVGKLFDRTFYPALFIIFLKLSLFSFEKIQRMLDYAEWRIFPDIHLKLSLNVDSQLTAWIY